MTFFTTSDRFHSVQMTTANRAGENARMNHDDKNKESAHHFPISIWLLTRHVKLLVAIGQKNLDKMAISSVQSGL
jgi:hypothetical protein